MQLAKQHKGLVRPLQERESGVVYAGKSKAGFEQPLVGLELTSSLQGLSTGL